MSRSARIAFLFAPALLAAPPLRAQEADDSIPVPLTLGKSSYTSGEAIGGLVAVAAFNQDNAPSGRIDWLAGSSVAGAVLNLTVLVFDAAPAGSLCTDGNAVTLTAADRPKLAAILALALTVQTGVLTASWAEDSALSLELKNQDPAAMPSLGTETPNLYL
jgi:hypothetical protein